jgi:hypothetical protein
MESFSFCYPNDAWGDFSMPVICEGCGRPVPIPEGYHRNKIQCSCGVICSVPEAERQEAATPAPARATPRAEIKPAAKDETERWLLDDDPPSPAPAQPTPPRARRAPKQVEQPTETKRRAEMRFKCRRCGRLVRRQGECPSCDADTTTAPEPVWWPSVDAPADEGEEDSSPYAVEGADDVVCPECSMRLPPGSVLCVRCGYHLTKRKKVAKTYQPIDRQWDTNGSRQGRMTFYLCIVIFSLIMGLIGVFVAGADLGIFIGSFLGLMIMLGFVLGTFDRTQLTRDSRGRVQLTKTWHVCFIARPPQMITVVGYESIASGRHRDIEQWDWLIFFFLFASGVIPGLIWWYFAIHKVNFHASLTRDHGYPAYVVYSGWDEMQMKEIAYTLRDATGLRYEEG